MREASEQIKSSDHISKEFPVIRSSSKAYLRMSAYSSCLLQSARELLVSLLIDFST